MKRVEFAVAPIRQLMPSEKFIGVAIALTLGCWIILDRGRWPEIYSLLPSDQLAAARATFARPIHLHDDVMIVMRSGQIMLETGLPALNRSDSAQPSTSYLMPYIAALLLLLFPPNIAVMALSVLGALCVAITFAAIVIFARSTTFGVVLTTLLAFTSTAAYFSLEGWDHIFQGMFLTLATALALSGHSLTKLRLFATGILLSLAFLARLDCIPILGAIILTAFLISARRRWVALYLLLPVICMVGFSLLLNYKQFGYLTPTTSRLKLGTPSLKYITHYVVENSILSFSAATLLILLVGLSLTTMHMLGVREMLPLTVAAIVSGTAAAVNSDVFSGARMFWTPAVAMACGLACRMPPFVSVKTQAVGEEDKREVGTYRKLALQLLPLVVAVSLLFTGLATGLRNAFVKPEDTLTRTAENYLLAEWINKNLDPNDGSIGLFWAGTSFHIPAFEIADFLGKGDEEIAKSPTKQGAPGHNKWDFRRTLQKWDPQAIITTSNDDLSGLEYFKMAKASVASQTVEFGFVSEFALDPEIRKRYLWCRVVRPKADRGEIIGLLLRQDIVSKLLIASECTPLWPPPNLEVG